MEKPKKPKMEDFIEKIPWIDSEGKPREAAGIDFPRYAFALERYLHELERELEKKCSC